MFPHDAGDSVEVFPAGGAQPDGPGGGPGEAQGAGRVTGLRQPQQRPGPGEDLPRDLRRAQVQQRNKA